MTTGTYGSGTANYHGIVGVKEKILSEWHTKDLASFFTLNN
jgi:hypothetical protein